MVELLHIFQGAEENAVAQYRECEIELEAQEERRQARGMANDDDDADSISDASTHHPVSHPPYAHPQGHPLPFTHHQGPYGSQAGHYSMESDSISNIILRILFPCMACSLQQ